MKRQRGQGGIALIELLAAIFLLGILMAGLGAWVGVTLFSQSDTLKTNLESNGYSLLTQRFTTDVAGAKFAATGTSLSPCPSPLAGETVQMALVTPRNQRVTYSLADATDDAVSQGKRVVRRECHNDLTPTASDPTTSDPLLTGVPGGGWSTPGPDVDLADGVDTFDVTCPDGDGGADPECHTLEAAIQAADETRNDATIQAERRINLYCPPDNCLPIPRISYPQPVARGEAVTFDGSASYDRRNRPLTYLWSVTPSAGTCGAATLSSAGSATASITFPDRAPGCPSYVVKLTVTAGSNSNAASVEVVVNGRRPDVTLTAPVGLTAIQNVDFSLQGVIATYEGSIDPASTSWSWGDGTAPQPFGCPAGTSESPPSGAVDACTRTGTHRFALPGTYVVKLTATDSAGLSTTKQVTVKVGTDTYYVLTSGTDSSTCGPLVDPCKTIQKGVDRSYDDGRRNLRVGGTGPFAPFAMRNGVSVAGGYSTDFTSADAETTTVNGPGSGSPAATVTASGLSIPTTLTGFVINGGTAPGGGRVTALRINGSTGVTLSKLTLNGGVGFEPAGMILESSSATADNLTVNSGSPQGAGSSAYGVRAVNASTLVISHSAISVDPGKAAPAPGSPSATPARAQNGAPGGDDGGQQGCGSPSTQNVGGTGGSGVGGGGSAGSGGVGRATRAAIRAPPASQALKAYPAATVATAATAREV